MKISSLISPRFKSQPRNINTDNTLRLPPDKITSDTFVKSSDKRPYSGVYISETEKLKPLNTENTTNDTAIVKDKNNFNKFYFVKNNEVLCWMQMSDKDDSIQVDKLYSINPKKHVGAGTELLKYAATKSLERGYGGRINLCMAGSQPFYRKCNFKLGKSPSEYDPALDAVFDFSARTNGKYTMGFSSRQTLFAFLDEEGAMALLENKRLFLKPDSKIMGEKTFDFDKNDKNAKINGFIDFCDVGDNKYVVQFLKVDKTESTVYQSAYILAELDENEDTPVLKVVDFKTFPLPFSCRKYEDKYSTEVYNELMNALKSRADELGFEVLE